MQCLGVIAPSQSEWWSLVVIMVKKDGCLRICIGFRKLNAMSEFDAYPMPGSMTCWRGSARPGGPDTESRKVSGPTTAGQSRGHPELSTPSHEEGSEVWPAGTGGSCCSSPPAQRH